MFEIPSVVLFLAYVVLPFLRSVGPEGAGEGVRDGVPSDEDGDPSSG